MLALEREGPTIGATPIEPILARCGVTVRCGVRDCAQVVAWRCKALRGIPRHMFSIFADLWFESVTNPDGPPKWRLVNIGVGVRRRRRRREDGGFSGT